MKIIKKHYSSKGLVFTILGIRISISKNSRLFSLIAKPRISVIVPVYNVAQYLEECLNSIINQKFVRIQVICVNDGSTDNSLEILKKYHKKDKRIKIINQHNQGLSAARNTGLRYVKGKYVMFVDSDDKIKDGAFSKLHKYMDKTSANFCIFSYCIMTKEKIMTVKKSQEFYQKKQGEIFSYKDINDKIFFRWAVWQKIFRTSFLKENNLQFPVGKIFEDVIFHIKSMIKASKICLYNEDFYYYRVDNASSIMNTSKNSGKNLHIVDAIDMGYDFLDKEKKLDGLLSYFCAFVVRETSGYLKASPLDVKRLLAQRTMSWLDAHDDIKNIIMADEQYSEYVKLLEESLS